MQVFLYLIFITAGMINEMKDSVTVTFLFVYLLFFKQWRDGMVMLKATLLALFVGLVEESCHCLGKEGCQAAGSQV